jgi:hypothetical protein
MILGFRPALQGVCRHARTTTFRLAVPSGALHLITVCRCCGKELK